MEILTRRTLFFGLAFSALLFTAQAPSFAQNQQIGVAAIVKNEVTGSFGGDLRRLKVSDNVLFEEVIQTGPQGRTQLMFLDESILTLGPSSEMILDEMVYEPQTNSGKMAINVTAGIMRFVSGQMEPKAYTFATPAATIGIRGTVFDLIVEPDGGTTVVVVEGEVTITVPATGQTVTVPPGQASTVTPQAPAPSPAAPPSPAVVTQVQTALSVTDDGGSETAPQTPDADTGPDTAADPDTGGGDEDAFDVGDDAETIEEIPVDAQTITEAVEEIPEVEVIERYDCQQQETC